MAKDKSSEKVKLVVGGRKRTFDVGNPKLPDWIDKNALKSGGFPYDSKLPGKGANFTVEALQVELVKLQSWMQSSGERVMVLFEGRDAAGKGGTIFVVHQFMNPRTARNVALTSADRDRARTMVLPALCDAFSDRRRIRQLRPLMVQPCGRRARHGLLHGRAARRFLDETPHFEDRICKEGIRILKIWLDIGQEMQLSRFHDRRHSPLKNWKFSPIDLAGMKLWDDYTKARDTMIARTHSAHAPWTIVRANDKRRARIAVMRRILRSIPYAGRDMSAVGEEDGKIIGEGPRFLGI